MSIDGIGESAHTVDGDLDDIASPQSKFAK
jgi:hypothetical protein